MFSNLRLAISHWSAVFARRFRNNFYLFLAAFLTVLIVLDASVFNVGTNMRQKAFDFTVRHRVVQPAPDPDIVIVDIDEASLAALSRDYGRWPWPRQVMGEFLEHLEAQQPKAVVFDILFSDADVYNPDSDAYFNEVVAGTDNTFFPFLRLSETQDHLSQISPEMIPGVQRIPAEAAANIPPAPGNIAVVLPHFEAMLKPGRIGTHNIYPDRDGIVREYRLYRDDYGWRIPSLPLVVGQAMGDKVPDQENMLLNWRGGPFTYRYASFSDVYLDMSAKTPKRPQNEFTGKIVIIGSTAPSLFDLKATAMAKTHPGVEILATAIDNVKNGDYLRFWRGTLPYLAMSLLLVWLTAAAFYRNVDRDRFNSIFSSSQVALLAISYIGINLTDTYVDLTGPVTWAIGYFSIAKVYALATDRALQRWLAFGVSLGEEGLQAILMPVLIASPEPLGEGTLKKIRGELLEIGKIPKNVESMKGIQSGIWGLFGDMLVIRWTCEHDNTAQADRIRQEAAGIGEQLAMALRRAGVPSGVDARYTLHEGLLSGEKPLAPQWRALFAQAILKLEHMQEEKDKA
ncbi:MAG: CHASE2 domain-containing protein [Methylophilaceae bacterium]